jgi:hypothetical protein
LTLDAIFDVLESRVILIGDVDECARICLNISSLAIKFSAFFSAFTSKNACFVEERLSQFAFARRFVSASSLVPFCSSKVPWPLLVLS